MAGKLNHRAVVAIPDDPPAGGVGPTKWNDSLVMSGGTDGQIPMRDSGQPDGWKLADVSVFQPAARPRGLIMRSRFINTGPGSNNPSKVLLERLDECVMSGGSVARNWPQLECNVDGGVGAGGLDAGTPLVGRWYEVHALYHPTGAAPATAPTVALNGAGNVTTGLHRWKVSFVTALGETLPGPQSAQLNVTPGTQQVSLTNVPLGTTGTLKRRIYRTVAGDTGDYKLVGEIADNVTTAFNDNIADGALGAVALTISTAGPTYGLILHLAKRWVKDIQQTVTNTQDTLMAGATDRVRLAQGFKVSVVRPITHVDLKLQAIGTSSDGSVWVTIEGDNGGDPDGTPLATSEIIGAGSIGTAAIADYRFIFPTPFTPASTSTQYHLVLRTDATPSGVNAVRWHGANSNQIASGVAKKFDGTNWANATTIDFGVTLHIQTDLDALVLPPGFTESCFLGYVRSAAVDGVTPFRQFNRWQAWGGQFAAVTPTVTTFSLNEMDTALPPAPVLVDIDVWSTFSAANGTCRVNGTHHLHTVGGFFAVSALVRTIPTAVTSVNTPLGVLGRIYVDTQGIYTEYVGTGVANPRMFVLGWELLGG